MVCRSVSVTVTVLDYNDNPPTLTNSNLEATHTVLEVCYIIWLQLLQTTTYAHLLQCQLDGRVLSTVSAVDGIDTGDYAEVAYEVVTGEHAYMI